MSAIRSRRSGWWDVRTIVSFRVWVFDMARTSVNVLGNCLASVVVARWEGEFDDKKAAAFLAEAPPKN